MNYLETLNLLIEEAPKSVSNLLYIASGGLLSAVIYLFIQNNKLRQDLTDRTEIWRKERDAKQEKEKEEYILMLEKTLNALTTIEKSLLENNLTLPDKLLEAVTKANEPLILAIRELLMKYDKK